MYIYILIYIYTYFHVKINLYIFCVKSKDVFINIFGKMFTGKTTIVPHGLTGEPVRGNFTI